MDVAVLEEADAGAENEIGSSFDVAVLVVIALDSAVLSISAISVQGILIADEAAAVEEEEIPVGENRHGLRDILALSRAVLEGDVFESDVA